MMYSWQAKWKFTKKDHPLSGTTGGATVTTKGAGHTDREEAKKLVKCAAALDLLNTSDMYRHFSVTELDQE